PSKQGSKWGLTQASCGAKNGATSGATGARPMSRERVVSRHLIQRGSQFYLRLAIPRALRPFMPPSKSGNVRDYITEPLGPNLDVARPAAAQLVANYERIFSRLRAGELLSPEQIAAEVSTDVVAVKRETLEALRAEREKWAHAM